MIRSAYDNLGYVLFATYIITFILGYAAGKFI